jgi:outer membrane protein assembly factor BamB
MPRLVLGIGLALLLALPPPSRAAQPQFWRIEGAQDLLDGTLDGLSVDAHGRVRLGLAEKLLQDTEAPDVWALARDSKGVVFAGTGNEGKVFKWEQGKGSLFYKAPELEVHALAVGRDGKLYAGTSPDGRVYAIDASGKGEAFFDPKDRYIWALVFDHEGNLLVATGSEGKVYRVAPTGKAQVLLTSSETHITSLAIDPKGNIYAGSSPGGIIFRIDPSGKVFALYDSPYREIAALDIGDDGTIYAAAADGGEKDEPAPRPLPSPPLPPVAATGGAEVIVTESIAAIPLISASPFPSRPPETTRAGAKGAILALLPSGTVDTLWTSAEEMPHSLVGTKDGIVFGTGNKGKLYRVQEDDTWTMLASFPSQQVTALSRGGSGELLLATSNPGRIYALGPGLAKAGSFLSKVKDTDVISAWGRVRYRAKGARVEVSTRSGNTQTPDSTWGEWSKPYAPGGDPVTSERARFLQIRVVLSGEGAESPVLDSVETGYLQRNLRPQVQTISVHPPGEVIQRPLSVTGEPEILGQDPSESAETRPALPSTPRSAGAASSMAYARKLYQKGMQTLSWKAEDPNGDPLVFTVEYRAQDDDHYHLLRKGFTEPVVAWDTSTVPSGRYVVRVTASDSPGNPEGLALTGTKESVPFDVDNTPPSVSATLLSRSPLKVRAVVKDDHSVVRKAEYSVDGGRWHEIYPSVGINDGLEETYEITITDLAGQGRHTVVVRGADLFGNVATARLDVP